jgi:cold shock CspA family protein
VLQFDQARGYGFVAADDGGEDVFLHASVFEGDPDILAPGMKIQFKVMAGDRGRKAFAAHLIDDEPVPENKLAPATRPIPAQALPPGPPRQPDTEEIRDEEQMCDVLSPGEFGHEITELLISDVSTLTGQQILKVREGLLECARKHGWVDI